MNKENIRSLIEQIGIIPAIRLSSTQGALFAAEAVSSSEAEQKIKQQVILAQAYRYQGAGEFQEHMEVLAFK